MQIAIVGAQPEHNVVLVPARSLDEIVVLPIASNSSALVVCANTGGALELLESTDLKLWKAREPFLVPGYVGHQPECSDYFLWNGWRYLLFGQDGATHYRLSRGTGGAWITPSVDILDDPQARVMKTAAFGSNRRIGVAFVAQKGFGGNLVFRELVQNPDGTLGTKFPPEMVPAAGSPIAWRATPLTSGATVSASTVKIRAGTGFGAAAVDGVPPDAHISVVLEPSAGTKSFGIALRGSGNYDKGVELRLDPHRRTAEWRAADATSLAHNPVASVHGVAGLDGPGYIGHCHERQYFRRVHQTAGEPPPIGRKWRVAAACSCLLSEGEFLRSLQPFVRFAPNHSTGAKAGDWEAR